MKSNTHHSVAHSFSQLRLWFYLLVALSLLLVGAALVERAGAATTPVNVRDYGAKGDGLTDDTAAFTAALATGSPVYVPIGRYKIGGTLALSANGVLSGAGPDSVLYKPETGGYDNILVPRSGSTVQDLAFAGDPSPTGKIRGVAVAGGATGVTLQRLTFTGLSFGVKIDGPNANLNLNHLTGRDCRTTLYAQNTVDSVFDTLDFIGYGTNQLDHCIYLSGGLQRDTFRNLTLARGGGYGLQLYGGTSSGLTFENLAIDATQGRWALVVGTGFSNVTFRNSTLKMGLTTSGLVQLGAAQNVLFDGFTAQGGNALVSKDSGTYASGITFANGVYQGPTLPTTHPWIQNLVYQNVKTGTLTVTSAPPTTTTTAPATTTTTSEPATAATIPAHTRAPQTAVVSSAAVAIVSPTSASVVFGKTPVLATVTSSVPVAKVRFYVNNSLLVTDFSAPYAFTWNAEYLEDTYSTLTAIAYDADDNSIGRASVTVTDARSIVPAALPGVSSPTITSPFRDLDSASPYAVAVLRLAEISAVDGYSDGSFGTDRSVTRAQVAKMVSATLGLVDTKVTATPFIDLGRPDANLYPHTFVAALVAVGALRGTSSSTFSPWNPVTRAQLVSIVVRAMRTLEPNSLAPPPAAFAQTMGSFSTDHDESVRLAEYNGLLNGLDGFGSTWDPWLPASRGEVAQILFNVASLL